MSSSIIKVLCWKWRNTRTWNHITNKSIKSQIWKTCSKQLIIIYKIKIMMKPWICIMVSKEKYLNIRIKNVYYFLNDTLTFYPIISTIFWKLILQIYFNSISWIALSISTRQTRTLSLTISTNLLISPSISI